MPRCRRTEGKVVCRRAAGIKNYERQGCVYRGLNYSDPFGLKVTPTDEVSTRIINRLWNGSATFRQIYRALKQAPASRVDIQVRVATPADHTTMFNAGIADGMAVRYGLSPRGDVAIDMRPDVRAQRQRDGVSDEEVMAEEIVHQGANFRNNAKTGVPLACVGEKCADEWKDRIMQEMRESQQSQQRRQQ